MLDFNFMWSIHSTSDPAGWLSFRLFARTLDFFLGKLAVTWAQRGFTAPFDPLWLLHVDGTGGKPRLLCHLSWTRYPPSACKSTVKACKSCIIVTSVLLGTPDAECTFPTLHKFQWCETTTYNLNRPFEYEVNVHTFCQHIVESREGSLDKPMHNRSDAHYACWFCISMACSPSIPSQTAPHKDACHAGDSFC